MPNLSNQSLGTKIRENCNESSQHIGVLQNRQWFHSSSDCDFEYAPHQTIRYYSKLPSSSSLSLSSWRTLFSLNSTLSLTFEVTISLFLLFYYFSAKAFISGVSVETVHFLTRCLEFPCSGENVTVLAAVLFLERPTDCPVLLIWSALVVAHLPRLRDALF